MSNWDCNMWTRWRHSSAWQIICDVRRGTCRWPFRLDIFQIFNMFQTQIPNSKSTAITESFLQPKKLHMLRWILECQRIKPIIWSVAALGWAEWLYCCEIVKGWIGSRATVEADSGRWELFAKGVGRGCDMVENNVTVLLQVHIGYEEFV